MVCHISKSNMAHANLCYTASIQACHIPLHIQVCPDGMQLSVSMLYWQLRHAVCHTPCLSSSRGMSFAPLLSVSHLQIDAILLIWNMPHNILMLSQWPATYRFHAKAWLVARHMALNHYPHEMPHKILTFQYCSSITYHFNTSAIHVACHILCHCFAKGHAKLHFLCQSSICPFTWQFYSYRMAQAAVHANAFVLAWHPKHTKSILLTFH